MDAGAISFVLNGETVHASGAPPQTTLLDFIRSRNLTGAKEGCAEGECGACAVAVVQSVGEGCAFKAINSCLLFLPMAAGREFYTVESLAAPEKLHPVQEAMAAAGGSQCGYCTPGFVMSLFAEYYRPDRAGACDVNALAGNLCRCTGYRPIGDAAKSLGAAPDDRFRRRLSSPQPGLPAFCYQQNGAVFHRPASLAECLKLLRNEPKSRLVAGNTDVGVESNLRYVRYPHLVSVEGVPELVSFRQTAQSVELGAALTLSEIEARWIDAPRVVKEWFALFASPLIRNRATLGGNLCTASPIGDAAPLLLALNASVTVVSQSGNRSIPLDGFFTGYRKTALAAGEMVVSIRIPKPFPEFARFYKAAKRRIPLFAQGYYRTPDLGYDPQTGQGKPFHYFAFGAAAAEVEVDGFTGDSQVLRVDILQDVGDSASPIIDRGQIEGGFIQGLGWLTIEELLWDNDGRITTNSASSYKLPAWSEQPQDFRVSFLTNASEPGVVFGSKAVGEPPLMLALSVREAIRDAIAAFGSGGPVTLDSPATPERVFWAVQTCAVQKAKTGKIHLSEAAAGALRA